MNVNYLQLANALIKENKLEEAIVVYAQAIEQNSRFYWSYHNLGEILAKLGRLDEAVNAYQQAIELNPSSAWSHHNIGDIWIELGHWDKAIVEYDRAINSNPNFYGFYNKLGDTFYQLALEVNSKSLPECEQLCEKLLEVLRQIRDSENYISALEYLRNEDFLETTSQLNDEDFLEKSYMNYLKREPDDSGKNHYLQHLMNGMTRQEIVAGFHQSPEFIAKLILSTASVCLQKAIVTYDHAINLKPNIHNSNENLAKAMNDLGLVLEKQGKFDEAIEIYQKILSLPPIEETYYNNSLVTLKQEAEIASAYRAIKLNPKLVQAYEMLLQLLPDNWYIWAKFGNILVTLKQEAEAISAYQRAIELNPGFVQAYEMLLQLQPDNWDIWAIFGNSLVTLNREGEAISAYQRAIELNPGFVQAYEMLLQLQPDNWDIWAKFGNSLVTLNQEGEAFFAYQRAIELNPGFVQAKEMLLQLQPDNWYIVGKSLAASGRWNQAIDSYQQALLINPNLEEDIISSLAEAYLQLGISFDEINRQDEAIYYWEKVVELKPDWIWGYLLIGIRFLLCGKREIWIDILQIASNIQYSLAQVYRLDKLGFRFLDPIWYGAIGHLGMLDGYVKMKILGWLPQNRTLALVDPCNTANPCMVSYWGEYIEIISDPVAIENFSPLVSYLTDTLYSVKLADGITTIYNEIAAAVQKQWEIEKRPPLISLSSIDYDRGWNCLQSLGVPKDAWFVCLHARGNGFNGDYHQGKQCQDYRNVEIETYYLAIQTIVESGGWVIRMGDSTMQSLPAMNQVIDYAHSQVKSDWMDVFLCAQCRFFIGTSSGLCMVPEVFGVPCVLTNWAPLGTNSKPWYGQDIFIPKLYWSENKHRYLDFNEAMSPPVGHAFSTQALSELGVRAVDNSPEEINAVVMEMLQRLNGQVEYTALDRELQERYHSVAKANHIDNNDHTSIGREFLHKYAWLLPESGKVQKRKKLTSDIDSYSEKENTLTWKFLLPSSDWEKTISAEKYLRVGKALLKQDQIFEAVDNLKNAVNLSSKNFEDSYISNSSEEYWNFGNLLLDNNYPEEAIKYYQKALSLNPGWKDGLAYLYDISIKLDKVEIAIDTYQKTIIIKPGCPESHYYLGLSLKYLYEKSVTPLSVDNAMAYYQQAIAPQMGGVEKNYNSVKDADNLLEKAIENFQNAITLSPDWSEAHYHLGNAFYLKKQLKAAIECYERVITLQPNETVYFQLGRTLMSDKQPENAIQNFQKVLEFDPHRSDAHWHIGMVLHEQDKLQEAVTYYRKALAIPNQPSEHYYYLFLGNVLSEIEQYDEAFVCWQKVIELKPEWIEIYASIAIRYWFLGKLDEWFSVLDRGLEVKQSLAKAHQLDKMGIQFLTEEWAEAIGHISLLDYYVKQAILTSQPLEQTILLSDPNRIANSSLLGYWGSYIRIITSPSEVQRLQPLARLLQYSVFIANLPNGEVIPFYQAAARVQKQWESEKRPPLLTLSNSDLERGWSVLHNLGLSKDSWFVCFHIREASFYDERQGLASIRNVDIAEYSLAINSIVASGGWVIRIGSSKMMPMSPMKQVIDYAHSEEKSDWMDVFLLSQCRFFLGSNSGPCLVPPTFGVPCVLTNWVPLITRPWPSQDIFIPKLYWSESQQRYLTFAEVLSPPLSSMWHTKLLSELDIKVVDNTAEQINDVVREMLDYLDGNLKYTEEDQRLQQRYDMLAEKHSSCYGLARLGRAFLSRYKNLLQ
ncbi:TIGR04372 family glycosyltransferase [Microcoleus sp.]|uniref:TIGR04372 family glycosyltransferase n=1 Tax=Microcoleus sp. TaxID=44472 RepID=UPI003526B858